MSKMGILAAVPLLFVIFAVIGASTLQRRAALTNLDQFSRRALTKLVRTELLDKVALELNETVKAEAALKADFHTCEIRVNQSIDACTSLAKSRCGSAPAPGNFLQILNPLNYISGPLNQIGSTLNDVKDLVGGESLKFFKSVGGLAASIGSKFPDAAQDILHGALNGLKDGLNIVGREFTSLGRNIFGGLSDFGSSLGNVVGNIGSTLGNVAGNLGRGLSDSFGTVGRGLGSVGRGIGKVFGFGKRSIDAATRRCMQKIPECKPLLLEETAMIRQICGDVLFNRQLALQARAEKMMGVYNATIDRVKPLIHQVEFEFAFNPSMTFAPVFVTATINKVRVRYPSTVPYRMTNLPQTAKELAVEYWNRS